MPVQMVVNYHRGRRKGWLRATGVFLPCLFSLKLGSSDHDPQAKPSPLPVLYGLFLNGWTKKKRKKGRKKENQMSIL